ncbi:MATE family efflux transporter [Flavivirga jejuensis]|uniref:Multidrug-efflux transporter n=1 Tax=Flavivirga jejuensis TaxID=870487 RepID=A0ABT8WUY2_9FLAO|nr:MATE family efflux transporter [Flavivirga jejuensis]MDO5976973.1 MATE family efflux transporter [Flavivirga jejuensis]
MKIKANYRNILVIAFPLILANLAVGISQIIDTAFVNRLGESELNGTMLASMALIFYSFIWGGFSEYSQMLVARKTGEKKYKEVGKILDHILLLGIVLLLFILGLFFLTKNGGLQWMVESEEIIENTIIYLDVIAVGLPFFILNSFFVAFFSGLGRTYIVTYGVLITIVVNLVLDYILIFGNFGFPELGVFGAALALIIAQMCTSILYICFIFKLGLIKKYALFKFKSIDVVFVKSITSKTFPLIVQNLFYITATWIFFIMIEKKGGSDLRTSYVVRSLYLFISIPAMAVGKAVNTIVSNLLGQGRKDHVLIAIFKSHQIGLGISLLLCVLLYIFPELFLNIYTNDTEEIAKAIPILQTILVSTLLFSVSMINMYAIIGIGETKIISYVAVISFSCYLLFAYYSIFEWKSSITIVWLSEWINWGLFTILSASYFLFWKIRVQKTKATLIEK